MRMHSPAEYGLRAVDEHAKHGGAAQSPCSDALEIIEMRVAERCVTPSRSPTHLPGANAPTGIAAVFSEAYSVVFEPHTDVHNAITEPRADAHDAINKLHANAHSIITNHVIWEPRTDGLLDLRAPCRARNAAVELRASVYSTITELRADAHSATAEPRASVNYGGAAEICVSAGGARVCGDFRRRVRARKMREYRRARIHIGQCRQRTGRTEWA